MCNLAGDQRRGNSVCLNKEENEKLAGDQRKGSSACTKENTKNSPVTNGEVTLFV